MFAQKTYHYVKITRALNDVSKASYSAFNVNVHCVYILQASAQAFGCFINSTIACASFSLSIKRRTDVWLAFFPNSLAITRKILEIYVTYDIINSNLVLIVLIIIIMFLVHAYISECARIA